MTSRLSFKCYHDCEGGRTVLACSTWAHHATLTVVEPYDLHKGEATNLDREAVARLVTQLQDWLKIS